MRKGKWKLLLVLAVLLAAGIYYYVALPAINLHSSGFWIFFIVLGLLILAAYASRRQLRTVSEIRESRFMKAGLVAVAQSFWFMWWAPSCPPPLSMQGNTASC